MMIRVFIFVFGCFFASSAFAGASDYAKYFQVDMNEQLPSFGELQKTYIKADDKYDAHYDNVWEIGEIFDRAFYVSISTYGALEKRLKTEDEEAILQMIANTPKEHYQYIGPMLHTIPGMSEKVLNIPGIKETKNKFPTRIAKEVKDIEDLEFLSPFLYFMLMPEAWGSAEMNLEFPEMKKSNPKVTYNAKFYNALKKLVPPENFMVDKKAEKKVSRSDMKTVNPTKNSLLTSTDVKAFISTIDGVNNFAKKGNRMLLLSQSVLLLNEYEKEKGEALPVNGLKDMVNPCQRLVRRIKVLGMEKEFAMEVAGEGWSPEEWAYTCDKTLKAYRAANVSSSTLLALRAYQNGVYDAEISKLQPKAQASQYSAMQSVIEMYSAPMNDVLEVMKNKKELREKIRKIENRLAGSPIETVD